MLAEETQKQTNLDWTKGTGRKLVTVDMSSPQSNMTVVPLNLTTKHGWLDWPDRQNYNINSENNHSNTDFNKKASIRWQDSAPAISGYWSTSEPNAG